MIKLPARVRMDEAGPVWTSFCAQLRLEIAQVQRGAGTQIELSAADLRDFDSSALSVLLGAARACAATGMGLRVDEPPPALVELARVYGVEELVFRRA